LKDLIIAFLASVLIVFSAASAKEYFAPENQIITKTQKADFGQAPVFEFVDQNGELFSSKSIDGPWLFNVFFTRCNGPCPMTLSNLMKLSEEIGDRHNLQIISVSVDPEYDSPEKLKKYAKANKLALPRWRFLSGELAEVNKVIEQGFKLGAMDDPKLHTTRVVVIDKNDIVRGYALGAESDDYTKLLSKVKELQSEELVTR